MTDGGDAQGETDAEDAASDEGANDTASVPTERAQPHKKRPAIGVTTATLRSSFLDGRIYPHEDHAKIELKRGGLVIAKTELWRWAAHPDRYERQRRRALRLPHERQRRPLEELAFDLAFDTVKTITVGAPVAEDGNSMLEFDRMTGIVIDAKKRAVLVQFNDRLLVGMIVKGNLERLRAYFMRNVPQLVHDEELVFPEATEPRVIGPFIGSLLLLTLLVALYVFFFI
jgi:hypothetical protein